VRDALERLTWKEDSFAFAEGWDEQKGRYKGLRAGQSCRVVSDPESLIVKPDVAAAQLEAERQPQPTPGSTVVGLAPVPGDGSLTGQPGGTGGPAVTIVTPLPPQLRRFHASVNLDPLRLGRDASRIAEEVVQHFSSIVGCKVHATLDLQVELPENASDKLVRDVTENCRTLKFGDYGFEES
jgi:hypothetical protein